MARSVFVVRHDEWHACLWCIPVASSLASCDEFGGVGQLFTRSGDFVTRPEGEATGELIRHLTLNPDRAYQPTGTKRGGSDAKKVGDGRCINSAPEMKGQRLPPSGFLPLPLRSPTRVPLLPPPLRTSPREWAKKPPLH